jgi:AbrB family looped-hinge helix DNA binding protein
MTTPTYLVRVQRKGQVTIPLALRQRLQLQEGDFVLFDVVDGGLLITPQRTLAGDAPAETVEKMRKVGAHVRARREAKKESGE